MTQPGMFSGPGKRVITVAQEELMALGHDWLGTEHLLLGLMRLEDDGGARLVLNAAANEAVAEQRDVAPRHVLLALLAEAHDPDTQRSPRRLNPIAHLSDAPLRAQRRRERRRWDHRPWWVRIRDPHGTVARETLTALGVDTPSPLATPATCDGPRGLGPRLDRVRRLRLTRVPPTEIWVDGWMW